MCVGGGVGVCVFVCRVCEALKIKLYGYFCVAYPCV